MSETMSFGNCAGITFAQWTKLSRSERAKQCETCSIHSCRVLIKKAAVSELCCVEGCQRPADMAFFSAIRKKKGTSLVSQMIGLEVCLEHYEEHFTLHLSWPLTDRGWTGLKGK